MIRRISSSLVLLAIIACGPGASGPPAEFRHAFARLACGPTDGPAIEIYLSREAAESATPPLPFVRIYLTRSVEELDGREWSVAGGNSQGSAWYSTEATSEEASSGRITVTSSNSGTLVEGTVDLLFLRFGHIHQDFEGPVLHNDHLCG